MSGISKRDAMQLVAKIRDANLSAHAYVARCGDGYYPYALGAIEAVLSEFLRMQGCTEAAAMLVSALRDMPTDVEIAARNAEIAKYLNSWPQVVARADGSAA